YFRPEAPSEQVQPRGSMPPSSTVGQQTASTSSLQESGQRIAPALPVTPIPPVLTNAPLEKGNPQPSRQEAEGEEASLALLAERAQEKPPDMTSTGFAITAPSVPEDYEAPVGETAFRADEATPRFF